PAQSNHGATSSLSEKGGPRDSWHTPCIDSATLRRTLRIPSRMSTSESDRTAMNRHRFNFDVCEFHASSPLLAHLPGLAKRPEPNPEKARIFDEKSPGDRRQGGEATETRLPDARRRNEEAQRRKEHPNRQGAAEGRNPR